MRTCLCSSIFVCVLIVLFLNLTFAAAPSVLSATAAQSKSAEVVKQAGPSPTPDNRFKADILVVLAHPDDETLVAGYLAKTVLDQSKRVAVLFATRGNAGDNEVAYEQAASLAAVREMEGRSALTSIGVTNVWFLNAPDTPAQYEHDVLRSLEAWNHGSVLGEVVRIMRLTRPAAVITFLPVVVAGENHEDHQAAGVIATEAFDMAGDPTRFAEQVAFPDDRTGYGNLKEGLRPWQPQKLYYFSDASHTDFLEGKGPRYSLSEVSAARKVPYYRLKAIESSFYLTQIGVGEAGKRAVETGNFKEFEAPELFVLGKSLVGGSVTGEILEGVTLNAVPFVATRGYLPQTGSEIAVELGGPWHFYGEFWEAHNLEHLGRLLPAPEIAVEGGGILPVPLLLYNNSNGDQWITLKMNLPRGWTEKNGTARYPVRAHEVYPVMTVLVAPSNKKAVWQELQFHAEAEGQASSAALRIFLGEGGAQ